MGLRIGCAAPPGNSRNNKTGSWRVFKPIYDYEICTACGICQSLCPDACITLVNEQYAPEYAFCKGCGICANDCPVDAITMVLEEK